MFNSPPPHPLIVIFLPIPTEQLIPSFQSSVSYPVEIELFFLSPLFIPPRLKRPISFPDPPSLDQVRQ